MGHDMGGGGTSADDPLLGAVLKLDEAPRGKE
jgi:hypothetical protein